MRLCLVEDLAVAGLEPLTLTRPVYELWLGCSSLGARLRGRSELGRGRGNEEAWFARIWFPSSTSAIPMWWSTIATGSHEGP
ncbi:MAG: putative sugar nucleotidyl transferase [Isosphaeraceae bacterium]